MLIMFTWQKMAPGVHIDLQALTTVDRTELILLKWNPFARQPGPPAVD